MGLGSKPTELPAELPASGDVMRKDTSPSYDWDVAGGTDFVDHDPFHIAVPISVTPAEYEAAPPDSHWNTKTTDDELGPRLNRLSFSSSTTNRQSSTRSSVFSTRSRLSTTSSVSTRHSMQDADSVFKPRSPRRASNRISGNSSASTRQSRQDPVPVPSLSTYIAPRNGTSRGNFRYYCTFCDASFILRTAWVAHENLRHDTPHRLQCDQCPRHFSQYDALSLHVQTVHPGSHIVSGPAATRSTVTRSAWGCGFCAKPFFSRVAYLDHIGAHYEEGQGRAQWEHSFVIFALLLQPHVSEAWKSLVSKCTSLDARIETKFSWPLATTGRSADPGSEMRQPQLQDLLEFFSVSTVLANVVAELALDLAECSVPVNKPDLPRLAPLSLMFKCKDDEADYRLPMLPDGMPKPRRARKSNPRVQLGCTRCK